MGSSPIQAPLAHDADSNVRGGPTGSHRSYEWGAPRSRPPWLTMRIAFLYRGAHEMILGVMGGGAGVVSTDRFRGSMRRMIREP